MARRRASTRTLAHLGIPIEELEYEPRSKTIDAMLAGDDVDAARQIRTGARANERVTVQRRASARDDEGEIFVVTPLVLAAALGLESSVEALLAAGAEPNARDDGGPPISTTPLHVAAALPSGDVAAAIVRRLLDAGATANEKDEFGLALPADIARRAGNTAALALLVKTARPSPTPKSTSKTTAKKPSTGELAHAARKGDVARITQLLDAGVAPDEPASWDDWKRTPLLLAAHYGHGECVDLLLRRGADRGAKGARGVGLVWSLSAGGLAEQIARELASGASPDAVADGRPALFVATEEGHVQAVAALLAAGADPNARAAKSKATPLHSAAAFEHVEIANLLLAAGADADAVDASGETPASIAKEGSREIEQAFAAHRRASASKR